MLSRRLLEEVFDFAKKKELPIRIEALSVDGWHRIAHQLRDLMKEKDVRVLGNITDVLSD